MSYDLRTVPLFSGLATDDLTRLTDSTVQMSLAAGELLFNEDDESDDAYVISMGELEITKDTAGQQMRIAISGPGDIVGEMALLTGETRSATARALTDVELIAIPKAALDELLTRSVSANQALFDVFISRWREQQARVRQSERMAQIGVLTAGLAHEMNNPAAAVSAGSESLVNVEKKRAALSAELGGQPLPTPSQDGPPRKALERVAIQDDIEDVLVQLGVENPWELAPTLTDAGYVAADLELEGEGASAAIQMAAVEAEIAFLLQEIQEGSKRLSTLVDALKSYSFLDQAPVQEYDVVKGIEDTLLILRSKLAGIEVRKDFGEGVGPIVAYGSQLNQVWTNLLDNAADAITEAGRPDGVIEVRLSDSDDGVVVEVENNGPPIPDDVIDHIFEAFFTTKEPGKGTGLGLDTSYNVVVTQHRGTLTVRSDAGATVFTVTIPRTQDGPRD